MASFWKDITGGFSQNSRDDMSKNTIVGEFDGDVPESIKDNIVKQEKPSQENNIQRREIPRNVNEEKKPAEDKRPDASSSGNVLLEEMLKAITESNTEDKKTTDETLQKDNNIANNEAEDTIDDIMKGQVGREMELNNRTIITKSTIIAGNISTEDDLIIEGSVCGDVDCKGKLTISGEVSGNAIAKSISINTSKFEGDVRSDGRIEIKEGTVIIGNIYGDEALISGAIKGEIFVSNGARLEKTAIVKGNIKAKSVQIDNGAVLQGFCELQYDNLNLEELFGIEEEEDNEVLPQNDKLDLQEAMVQELVAEKMVEPEPEVEELEPVVEPEPIVEPEPEIEPEPEVEEVDPVVEEEPVMEAEPETITEVVVEPIEEEEEVEMPLVEDTFGEEVIPLDDDDEEESLEEALERELEEEAAANADETSEEDREQYIKEMEDNYSNFMEQLQMDAES